MSTAETPVTKSRRPKMVLRPQKPVEPPLPLDTDDEFHEEPEEGQPPVNAPKPTKYKGLKTGMRVIEYQRLSLENNFRNHLTDTQLAADWCEEFPNAITFTPRIVASARSAFNRGKLGQMPVPPDQELHPYDESGNELPLRARTKKN